MSTFPLAYTRWEWSGHCLPLPHRQTEASSRSRTQGYHLCWRKDMPKAVWQLFFACAFQKTIKYTQHMHISPLNVIWHLLWIRNDQIITFHGEKLFFLWVYTRLFPVFPWVDPWDGVCWFHSKGMDANEQNWLKEILGSWRWEQTLSRAILIAVKYSKE